jgi:M6 family metalloprotease-like protein
MRKFLVPVVLMLVVGLLSATGPAPAHAASTPSSQPPLTHRPAPFVDEIGLRHEANLGIPDKPDDGTPGEAGVLDGDPWLATSARQFITVRKEAFIRGSFRAVNGVQVASSFVATTDNHVAFHFSADALVETVGGTKPGDRRMFVRALLDGVPTSPGDVVLTVGPNPGARAFVFTAEVNAGVHTVEIQWKVDGPRGDEVDVVGRMLDAALMVRQGAALSGTGITSVGTFETRTAPSGLSKSKADAAWSTIPDMSHPVRVAPGAALVATFSAESRSLGSARLALRAVVDGVPMLPTDMILAKGGWSARSATFVLHGVAPGVHTVSFQWLADGAGSVEVGDRSLALAGLASPAGQPSHPAAALSGVQDSSTESGPAPGLTLPVWIPERGNGEVAVVFSAEVGTSGGPAGFALAVDGQLRPETAVELLADEETQGRSWVFEAKDLAAGLHEVAVWWLGSETTKVVLGDRSIAAVAETGAIPDLAEAAHLGTGKYAEGDHIPGVEAVIGGRPVLTILWDADRPDHPNDITAADAGLAMGRVGGYFGSVSGGRFQPTDAGVVGPYQALADEATSYWNHPAGSCQAGFDSGATHRRSEAVLASNSDVDYADFDADNDGQVEAHELAIVVVYKEVGSGFGQARTPLAAQTCPGADQPLVLDGVEIEEAVDWFVDQPSQDWMVLAHELGHHQLGLDDLYYGDSSGTVAHRADTRSLMGVLGDGATPHLDPAHKLALGWATPRMVLQSGYRSVVDVKLSGTVEVLPRWNTTRRDEYFVVENRQSDLGWSVHDDGLGTSGVLVWHVAEDESDNATTPIGSDPSVFTSAAWDTQARRGLRLLRPFDKIVDGAAITTSSEAGWHSGRYPLVPAPCPIVPDLPGVATPVQNTMTWADCTASPYTLRNWSDLPVAADPLDPPSTEMGFDVSVAG